MPQGWEYFVIQLLFLAGVLCFFRVVLLRHRREFRRIYANLDTLEKERADLLETLQAHRKAEAVRKRQAARTAAHHADV